MWSSLMHVFSLLSTVVFAAGLGIGCGVVVLVVAFVWITVRRSSAKRHRAHQWAVYDRAAWEEVE